MKTFRLILILCLALCSKTNAQEAVDLGLSICWASTNMGASSPKKVGSYYIWNTSTPSDNWGSEWRMPTKAEVQELINKCNWTKTSEGYKIVGPNGNEIFLPITGFKMDGASKTYSSAYMFYWTSTQSSDMSYALSDQSGGVSCNTMYETGWTKMAIRPVCKKTAAGSHSGDLGLSVEWSLTNFNTSEVGESGMLGPQRLANLNLKDGWRLPTKAEIQELIDNCSWTTTTVNGYSVFKATAPNGNYIYFPKTGYMPSAGMDGRVSDSDYGYYWTSTSTGGKYYVLKLQSANNVQITTLSDSYSAAIRAVKTSSSQPTYTLDVSTSSLSFAYSAESKKVDITSNTSYSITADEAWINLSSTSGNGNKTLTISVQSNSTNTERTGHVTISSSSLSKTITITQSSYPKLELSTTEINFLTGDEETKSLDIISNTSYTISTQESWIVLSHSNGTGNMSLSITVSENLTGGYRTGHIWVSSPTQSHSITITQYGTIKKCIASVDLGLPSGILWATCNVGALQPEELGLPFEWATTEIGAATPTKDKSNEVLFNEGIIDKNGNLTPEYDVASVIWGNGWRTPTNNEIEELVGNCQFTLNSQNGVMGYTITGNNHNSIFLPMQESNWANYSSSTPKEEDEAYYPEVFMLRITPEYYKVYPNRRHYKYFVRPVIASDETGIRDVEDVPNEYGCLNVYNLNGVCVVKINNLSDLRKLPKGIYIVNDRKIAIK